jgi:large subunit ribosomal protein L30
VNVAAGKTSGKTSKASGKTGGKAKRAGSSKAAGSIAVTLEKSIHGQLRRIAASVRGLGLRRPHQTVQVADTAPNRGMIRAASHLLRVEEK